MRLVKTLFKRDDVNITDVVLNALMAWWALWLLLPFSTVIDSRAYADMYAIAHRYTWAAFMLGMVAGKIYSVLRCHWRLRGAILTMMTMWWSFISIMAGLASPYSPGWGLLGIVTIMAAWRTLQIAAGGAELEQCDIHKDGE